MKILLLFKTNKKKDSRRVKTQQAKTIQLSIIEEGQASTLNLVEDDTKPAIANQVVSLFTCYLIVYKYVFNNTEIC